MNLDFKIQKPQGHFWKKRRTRKKTIEWEK